MTITAEARRLILENLLRSYKASLAESTAALSSGLPFPDDIRALIEGIRKNDLEQIALLEASI